MAVAEVLAVVDLVVLLVGFEVEEITVFSVVGDFVVFFVVHLVVLAVVFSVAVGFSVLDAVDWVVLSVARVSVAEAVASVVDSVVVAVVSSVVVVVVVDSVVVVVVVVASVVVDSLSCGAGVAAGVPQAVKAIDIITNRATIRLERIFIEVLLSYQTTQDGQCTEQSQFFH